MVEEKRSVAIGRALMDRLRDLKMRIGSSMRKWEIAVGVLDLLAIPLSILLFNVVEAMGIGTYGGADGPTAIYLMTGRVSYVTAVVAVAISPPVSSGVLLLIPLRWKAVVLLSVLFGFLHALYVLIGSWEIIDLFYYFGRWHGIFSYPFASEWCFLLLNFTNMSLFFRRGVGQWRKKEDPLPSIEL